MMCQALLDFLLLIIPDCTIDVKRLFDFQDQLLNGVDLDEVE
jgi:hypothetical protein